MSDQFPDPPKFLEPVERKLPDADRSAARALATVAVVLVLAAVTVAGFLFLTGGEAPVKAKPSPTVSVAPAVPSSPCAHETFAVGSCANLVLANIAENAGLTTQATLQTICDDVKDKPRRQEEVIQAWIESGAHPDDARAVLFYILAACP